MIHGGPSQRQALATIRSFNSGPDGRAIKEEAMMAVNRDRVYNPAGRRPRYFPLISHNCISPGL